jgi:hypothetical protein
LYPDAVVPDVLQPTSYGTVPFQCWHSACGVAGMRWFLFTIVVAAAAGVVALVRARGKQNQPDIGTVSNEWIAQHRSDLPHY